MLFLLTLCSSLWAQSDRGALPVSVSYFGGFAYQPGIKLATEISLVRRQDTENYSRQWYGSPQLAFYTNPGSDSNYLINFETGIGRQKKDKNTYWSYSIGLGYLMESKIRSFSVNLGTGDKSNKRRASQSFLLPSLNVERGWRTHRPLSWFTKYSVGSTLFGGDENQLMMFLEFGVKFKIKKETKPRSK